MDKRIYGIFTICNGSSHEWAETNPILEKGEIGYDSTINQIKVGDGKTTWDNLPWVSGGGDTTEDIINHMKDYNNPHRITASQTGAIPADLKDVPKRMAINSKERKRMCVYVTDSNTGSKISLEDIKNMNTKIHIANTITDVNPDLLTIGDFIYTKQ